MTTNGVPDGAESSMDHQSDPAPRPGPRRWPLGVLTLLVVAAVGIGLAVLRDSPPPANPDDGPSGFPRSGDPAPDFAITLLDGTDFRLATHLAGDGRPVILNLWASWCSPCRAEMPALDAAAAAHPEILLLGVAVDDDPAAAAQFVTEIGVTYPLAVDEAERVGRRYPTPGLPATFFIGADGVIVRTVYGQLREDEITMLIASLFE